jgi:hypothetical protein
LPLNVWEIVCRADAAAPGGCVVVLARHASNRRHKDVVFLSLCT